MSETLKDINGTEPRNSYLWPTESWDPEWHERNGFMYHIRGMNFPPGCKFGIIALSDGRFSVDGHTYNIEKNIGTYGETPVVFKCRTQAIRAAAARMLRHALYRYRNNPDCHAIHRIDNEMFCKLYNWTLETVAFATGQDNYKEIRLKNSQPLQIAASAKPKFEDSLELWQVAE